LLFDTGKQRNRFSNGMRNYLTRDNILPLDFLKIAHTELKKYGVSSIRMEIIHAEKLQTGIFHVKDEKGISYYSKKLLIATGLQDKFPDVEGVVLFYGKSVFHCPYCDAWEVRDKNIGVYAKNKNGFELAMSLKTWTKQVSLFTNGRNYLKPLEKEILQKKKIEVFTQKIARLEGRNGELAGIDIVKELGCKMNKKGVVVTNHLQQANIAGLYIAGDVSKDMHFVVVAAAEGAKAGVSINKELQKEEFKAG